jgi:hypothetical protein
MMVMINYDSLSEPVMTIMIICGLFLLNNKFPILNFIVFGCYAVKINSCGERVAVEGDGAACEMLRLLHQCTENIFDFYFSLRKIICAEGERGGGGEGVGGKHETNVVQSLKFKV